MFECLTHRELHCWEMWPYWGKHVTMETDFEVLYAQARPSNSLLLLPPNQDVKISCSSLASCLPECYHIFYYDNNRLNIQNCKLAQLNIFLYKGCCVHGFSSHNKTLTKTSSIWFYSMFQGYPVSGSKSPKQC